MKKLIYIISALLPVFLAAQIDSNSKSLDLNDVVIVAISPSFKKPITHSSIESKKLRQFYYGADVPSVLQQLPSLNAYSDNGTGIGYSFFRMRGIDQTRINTTINGIPVNDPENQGVFFNNFADLLSGTSSIQVQRGLGTSTNGVAAFGGSVQMNTLPASSSFGVELNAGIGSFGSSRLTAGVHSGLIKEKWLSFIKIGQVKTNGFRDNSASEVTSYQVSLSRLFNKGNLTFNSFGGFAKNQLAYLGIDKASFESNPKTNPFVNQESDAFRQLFNQLQYTYSPNGRNTIQASAYFVRGIAPKFQFLFPESWGYGYTFFNMPSYISGTDTSLFAGDMMTSYCLDQQFYGAFVTHTYRKGRIELNSGIHANYFKADHFMIVEKGSRIPAGIESDHEVYRNTGIKKELSGFVKAQLAIQDRLNLFADVQLRLAGFSYADKAMAIRPSYGSVEDMQWAFVNPRVGLNYNVAQGHLLYGFTGIGYREPTRFDYLQDDFAPRDIQQNEINPERVWNTELGYRLSGPFSISANLFAMEFSNQIVGTGALNPFGYAITGNVGRSWRRGAEVEYRIPLDNMWSIAGHSALCYSGIKELKQSYNPYDSIPTVVVYKNKELAFTPRQIHQIGVFFESRDKQWEGFAQVRYVSRQFLDNTENKDLQLPSFQTLDARIAYCFFSPKRERTAVKLAFRVNNILNAKYAPNGSVTGPNTIDAAGNRGQSALYLPAAGLNYFITLSFNY